MNLCGKSSRFADFENTVDRGSAVIFDADSGFGACLMFGSWVQNKIWILDLFFFTLDRYVNESSKLFLFFRRKLI